MFKYTHSDVTLLFEHSSSRASEIEHFEIFSHPRENQLAIVLSHFLMSGVFYAYTEEYKHNDLFSKDTTNLYNMYKMKVYKTSKCL